MFQAFVDSRSVEIERLWDQVANGHVEQRGKKRIYIQADPAQALNILGRLAEFILPKLSRSEVTGADGAALVPPRIGITFDGGGPGEGGQVFDNVDESSPAAPESDGTPKP